MTYNKGAKMIDILGYLRTNNKAGLMKLVKRALANRKTRDNVTNDISSRSILVLTVYAIHKD